MNLLRFAGVTREGPAAQSVIDDKLHRILAVGARAHERLRNNLRDDPRFAGVICRALGCDKGDCADIVPKPLARKVHLVPEVVRKIEQAKVQEKITSLAETPLTS